MVNGVTITVPRNVIIPLRRVVTGIAIGLVEVAAEFADERLNLPARQVLNVQTMLPVVGTIAGIGLALTKNATARIIGNDMAVGFGTIATLKLGNAARRAIAGRKMKQLRQVALSRGGAQQIAQHSGPASAASLKHTTMSLA